MNTPADRPKPALAKVTWPATATIALILGACTTAVVPTASPSESAEESAADATYRAGDVLIGLQQPAGWEIRSETRERVVGFDDRTDATTSPLDYGWMGARKEAGAHGIVLADLTGVDFHNNDQPPHARTAAEFLDNLALLNMGTWADPSYTVGAIEGTAIGEQPALTADIEANTGYALFEGRNGHLALDLTVPQRVFVADVGSSILLVQIWAKSEVDLAAWLPRAEELLDLMVFASDS